jgi:hypothetical protein
MKKSKKDLILHTDLKGKDWMYNSNIYHILDVLDNGTRIIATNRKWTFGTEEERDYFLAELLPCEQEPINLPAKPAKNVIVKFEADKKSEDLFSQMLGELKEDFDKLKTDRDYMVQASQRCRTVSTMTNLVKTRIQLEKFNRG